MQRETSTTKARRISLRLVLLLTVSAAFILLLWFITDEIVLENEQSFDNRVFQILANYISPGLTQTMLVFTFFGSTKFLLPAYVALVLYYIFYKKNTRFSFDIAAIAATSIALLFSVKSIFKRHRPPHPLIQNVQGFSYPSGHSFSAFTFCGILIYIIWQSTTGKPVKIISAVLLFLFASMVALSRVYLHVHYASDVIAGFCLSFLWLTLSIYLLKKFRKTKIDQQENTA